MHARFGERARTLLSHAVSNTITEKKRERERERVSRIFYVSTKGKLRDRGNYACYLQRLRCGSTANAKSGGTQTMRQRNIPISWGFREFGIPLSYSIRHRVFHFTSLFLSLSLKEKVNNTHASFRYNIESTIHLNINELRWTNGWSLDEHVITLTRICNSNVQLCSDRR